MASVTFKTTENRIQARLNTMLSKARDPRALLNTVIFDMYKQAQLNRWQTENVSETGQWKPISEKYAERKRKKYKSYPGSGSKLMIATGTLADSASGKKYLKKVVTTRGMVISIDDASVPYAKYVAEIRPIMSFGDETIFKMKDAIGAYLMRR